jgi:hypothetical protein
MSPNCIQAVQQAAGRALSRAELKAIDERMVATMRRLAVQDPTTWRGMPRDDRVLAAAAQAMQDIHTEAARKVANVQRQVVKTAETANRVDQQRQSYGSNQTAALVRDMENSQHYADGIKNDTVREMLDLIEAGKSGEGTGIGRKALMSLFDAENPVMSRDLAHEIFNNASGSTGNTIAKQAAKVWLESIEGLRTRFNAAGGNVRKLDYGYLPQPHEQARVLAAGRDGWANKLLPQLDRSRYLNEDGSRMSDGEVLDVLRGAWDTISSDGLNKQTPGQFSGSGARANSGSESRQIHFKDAQSYLDYMAEFGRGSMYDSMVGHIGGMSRDIGLVERYGPNPEQQMRVQMDQARIADGGDKRVFGLLPESYWSVLNGASAAPQSPRIALIGKDLRNIQTAAKLGGAVISSITDLGTFFVTAGYNKLPYWDAVANIARQGSKETREFLAGHGIIADSLISDLSRWSGDNLGHNWSGRIANSTMKLSGMNVWTDSLRNAFQMTMMGGLARMSRVDWFKLSEFDRIRMKRHGLTEDDWKVMQSAQLTPHGGQEFLTPDAIYAVDVEKVRPESMQAIRDAVTAETGELSARNAKERQWIGGRLDKFDEARDALNRAVKELRSKKLAKNDKAAEGLQERIDLLETQVEEAKLQSDLEGEYNKLFTKADADAFEAGMRSAGTDLNRASSAAITAADRAGEKFGRRRQRLESQMRATQKRIDGSDADGGRLQQIDRKQVEVERAALERDIEEAFKSYPKAEREAFRTALDSFGDVRKSASQGIRSAEQIGRRYGEQKGRMERRVQELQNRIGEMDRVTGREVNVAAKEAQKKADAMAKDLAEFIKRSQERQSRRQFVIDRIQAQEMPRIEAEAQRIKQEVAAKMLGLIKDEGEMAVINPDMSTRAIATWGGDQAGTVRGELARSVMQFKSFPIAMISRHWRRMMDMPSVPGAPFNRLAYGAAMAVSLTALGAVAFQMKQLLQGKDPAGMDTPKFWARAALQGGAMGILGDLMLQDPSDSPGDAAANAVKNIAGPTPGAAFELAFKLGAENVWEAAKGKDTHAAAEALRFLKSNTPLVNLWYTRAALDHAVLQQIQENASPGYLARMKDRARKDFGQDYWWQPGEAVPERAPNLSTMGGQ